MTSLRQTIARNTFWLLAGQVISRVLKFGLVAYAARMLGVEAIGSLTYATALTTLSFTFSDVGLGTLLVREYQKSEQPGRLVVTLAKFKALLVALSAIVACSAYLIFGGAPGPLLLLALATTMFDVTRDFVTSIARAKEKGHLEAIILSVEGVLTVTFGFLILAAHGTIFALAGAYALAALVTLLVAGAIFFPEFRYRGNSEDHRAIRQMVKDLWPFAAAAAIAVIFTQVDAVLLGRMNGPEDAGLYGAGSRIMQILLVLPALIGVSVLPTLSRLKSESAAQARIVRGALSGVLLLAVPLAWGGAIMAPAVLSLVYGSAFAPGGTAFALLLFSFLFFAVTTVLDYLLLSRNLQAKNFAYTAIAAGVNIALSVALIPNFGPAGAASAGLAAQALNLALTLRFARKTVREPLIAWGDVSRYAVAATAMAAAVYLLPLGTAPRIFIGGVLYGALLIVLRTPFVREWVGRAA